MSTGTTILYNMSRVNIGTPRKSSKQKWDNLTFTSSIVIVRFNKNHIRQKSLLNSLNKEKQSSFSVTWEGSFFFSGLSSNGSAGDCWNRQTIIPKHHPAYYLFQFKFSYVEDFQSENLIVLLQLWQFRRRRMRTISQLGWNFNLFLIFSLTNKNEVRYRRCCRRSFFELNNKKHISQTIDQQKNDKWLTTSLS